MKWSPGDRGNIEDMRGRSGFRAVPIGIGGLVILALVSWATGTNFLSLLDTQSTPSQTVGSQGLVESTPQEERMVDFVDAVANDVQGMWEQKLGGRYERTRIVLFRDSIESACGSAESATGPFYCPGDRKVYLDIGFLDELTRRFGAPGDFAKAYVIAHEVGHHVQQLLGIGDSVRKAEGRAASRTEANRYSIALELQADCYAGVWAAHAGQVSGGKVALEPGDLQEGLRAAAAIGDHTLQRQTQGRVVPDSFTHGTSAERQHWLEQGYSTGDPKACDTFGKGR
jgi:predicted metalloprotease